MKNWTYVFVSSKERLTDTGENFLKWTRVFSTRCWVILVAQARRKKREENSVSTFGRFSLLTSLESSPVSVNDKKLIFISTVPTIYKHFSHSKHTLFALTKICLFWEEEDFGKINSLYFFNIESFKTYFLLFLKNCVTQDSIWSFLGNFSLVSLKIRVIFLQFCKKKIH